MRSELEDLSFTNNLPDYEAPAVSKEEVRIASHYDDEDFKTRVLVSVEKGRRFQARPPRGKQ